MKRIEKTQLMLATSIKQEEKKEDNNKKGVL